MNHHKILFVAFALALLAGSPLASAAPDKSLSWTHQSLRPVAVNLTPDGLRLALQVRDYCTTLMGKQEVPVYCSNWEVLGEQRPARPLVFAGVRSADDENKTKRLEERTGEVEAADDITLSLVLTEPFNSEALPVSWLARESAAKPSGWLLPASELGRLLLATEFLDSSPPAASLAFELRVESTTHGTVLTKDRKESQTVRVELNQDDNQSAWECAGAETWTQQKLLGGLEADDSGRPSLTQALAVASRLTSSCEAVAAQVVRGSCPALSQLVGPWDGPTLSQYEGEVETLLGACDPQGADSRALRGDLGKQLTELYGAASDLDDSGKLVATMAGRAFEARWGKRLPDDELLQAGRDLANALMKELQATYTGHLKAGRFGAAETIEIALSGLDEAWDTSAGESFEASLRSAIEAQIKGKDSAAVGAALDLLTEQLGPRAGEVQSNYREAVAAQVDAATVAADYEALDGLILSHQDHLGPGWADETQETSRVIREAKAFDEIDAALTKTDIKALQKTRLRHEAVLGPIWAAEVEKKLALLVFAELDSRIARGLVQGAIKWLDTHQDKVPEEDVSEARSRLDSIVGGDPDELLRAAGEQLDLAQDQLSVALSKEGEWVTAIREQIGAFKPKDDFETDDEFLKRLAVLEGTILPLRLKHLKEPLRQLGVARNRVFITKQLSASIEKDKYDVNAKVWNVTVQHEAYRREQVTVKLADLEGKNARTLFENREKVDLEGTLILGLDGRPILHEVRVSEAGSGAKGSWTSKGTVGKAYGANPTGDQSADSIPFTARDHSSSSAKNTGGWVAWFSPRREASTLRHRERCPTWTGDWTTSSPLRW